MLRKNQSALAPRFSRRRLTHARSKGEEIRGPSLSSLNISFSSQTTPCSLTSPVTKDTYHHHLPQFFTHFRTLQVPYYHSLCPLILTLNRPPQSEEALTLSFSFLCPQLENLALDSFSSTISLLSGRSNPNPPITSL
ncbi:hypothetical protein M6B38_222785 [Iris pallida]|uniref:Uncharacterized protein n=1 Tax=Iris pallida TaxID=29817 RepID=A0AAX6DWQ4_IRIPA|nr:hypothetical protein M6B38_222785 [Iris pallida]